MCCDEHYDKKFKCEQCDKSFCQQQNLRRHILIIHENETYKCDLCDLAFYTKTYLKTHLKTHQRKNKKGSGPEQNIIKILNTYNVILIYDKPFANLKGIKTD